MHGECGGYLRFGHHLQSTQHSLLPIFFFFFFVWLNAKFFLLVCVFFLLRGRITEEVNFEGIFHRKKLAVKRFSENNLFSIKQP